jgi:hypothetical protein
MYCNILVGKAPFLAAYTNQFYQFSVCEVNGGIIKEEKYIADCNKRKSSKAGSLVLTD